ncbi:GSCOCG00005574001-RA-CDS [Cotesia congregata]|uniref:Uncharacterized protein n=1 Tax=Cotesia congregata TaxID=51543 RepID=A0A8J2HG94_COTCN|nr:GSCOCG00005574001-RA-CDS [Cotesia congregata]CAG5093468.1 Protein of unknown function [Cotesia congregata]
MKLKLSTSVIFILMVVTFTTTQENSTPTTFLLGIDCSHDRNCTFQNSYCDNEFYRCRCRDNYYPANNQSVCIQYAQTLLGHCERAIGCKLMNNTECRKNACKCRTGFENQDGKCTPTVFNCIDDCEKNRPGRICKMGECNCDENTAYFEWNDTLHWCALYANRLEIDTCFGREGCRYLPNSRCTSYHKCICKKSYTQKDNRCLADINGSCTETSYCNVNNSFCNNWQQCECKYGYFPSNDNKTCIKYEIDGPCDYYNRCDSLSHAECVNGKCKCIKGSWSIEGLCIHSKDIYENSSDSIGDSKSYPCGNCTCTSVSYKVPKSCDKITNECIEEHNMDIVKMKCSSLAESGFDCQDPNKCKKLS